MTLTVYDHSIIYILPLLDISHILGQTGRLQKLMFWLQTIFAAYWQMSLMCMLWTLDYQDFQLPE